MAPEPNGGPPRDDADEAQEQREEARRAAQASADELARMGIDPRAVGLEPVPPPVSPIPPVPPAPSTPPTYRGHAPAPTGPAPPPEAAPGPGSYRGQARPPTVVPPPASAPVSGAPVSGAPVSGAPAGGPPVSSPPASPDSPVGPWGLASPVAGDAADLAAPSARGAAPAPPGTIAPAPPTVPASPAGPDQPGAAAPPGWAAPTNYLGQPVVPQPVVPPETTAAEQVDSTLSRPIRGGAHPLSPAATGHIEPLGSLVAGNHRFGRDRGWRRIVRSVTRGLIEPGAAARIEQERQLVARVRLRRPEPRLIAFVAGKGGVGTTTAAAAVAHALATLRNDTTALVSARSGAASLGQRLNGQAAPPVTELADAPDQAPLWLHGSLAVVDGAPWHTPTSRAALVQVLDRLRGEHPHTVVDIGNDLGEAAAGGLGRADQIVLVTSASGDAVAAARVALSRVHEANPFLLATASVALTCLNERQYRRTARRLRTELGMDLTRIVPIPFDPWLGSGQQIDPARMRSTTRDAYVQLASLVVEPGGPDQWFAQPSPPSPPSPPIPPPQPVGPAGPGSPG